MVFLNKLLEVALYRPVVLFEGTGELVGAVLAGDKVEILRCCRVQRRFKRIGAGISDGPGR